MEKIKCFENKFRERKFIVEISTSEWTSICPLTGTPDFGKITIKYIPDEKCIELDSLKHYFIDFRHRSLFYEEAVNIILEDLTSASSPLMMEVTGEFTTRGGMTTTVQASYKKGDK